MRGSLQLQIIPITNLGGLYIHINQITINRTWSINIQLNYMKLMWPAVVLYFNTDSHLKIFFCFGALSVVSVLSSQCGILAFIYPAPYSRWSAGCKQALPLCLHWNSSALQCILLSSGAKVARTAWVTSLTSNMNKYVSFSNSTCPRSFEQDHTLFICPTLL